MKWTTKVYRWLQNNLIHLSPPACQLCGAAGMDRLELCRGCRADLPASPAGCIRCGTPLNLPGPQVCGACQRRVPPYDRLSTTFRYAPPIDHLIQALKFQHQLAPGRLLGELMALRLAQQADPLPQALIPVPLHPQRLRQRGYNQALELARPISRHLGIPLRPDLCARTRATPSQLGLRLRARQRNLRDAFVVIAPHALRHVAIIDDVVTTGSTVAELTRCLKASGIERVEVWACARAGRD